MATKANQSQLNFVSPDERHADLDIRVFWLKEDSY